MKGQNKDATEKRFLLAVCLLAFALLLSGCIIPPAQAPPAPETPPDTRTPIPVTQPHLPTAECNTKECFVAAANECKEKSMLVAEDFGTVEYSAKDCVFTKTIVSLDDSEPQDMRDILEGKSLTCKYEKGGFDEEWTGSLILGIENCEGGLRDALALLATFVPE